jgi:hypothetical protein
MTPSQVVLDTMFLEIAAAADAPLVSGNARHFPPECRGNVTLMTPTEFLTTLTCSLNRLDVAAEATANFQEIDAKSVELIQPDITCGWISRLSHLEA